MSLVNALCVEIAVYQGVGEPTGTVVERRDVRGKVGLCKSMRDLATKSRVLGDGYYYIPVDLWPSKKEPVRIHKNDWTVIGSLARSGSERRRKGRKST